MTVRDALADQPQRWLVTGVAGFIGCNLLETLLELGQQVVGLDNFSTGHRHNLEKIEAAVGPRRWANFSFIEGDIRELEACRAAVQGVDHVLHQAALGSVPRSIDNPILTNQSNIDGFLNMLVAVRDAGISRLVYAASSSTYGDHTGLPKVEERIGNPLSPYAVTKLVNELYADVFGRTYGLESIGLRYFNIFGPRQDPDGPYAAVIPRWIDSCLKDNPAEIYGDGKTSRDFCFVANAIQANLLAATTTNPKAVNQVFNVAVGEQTSLNSLHDLIQTEVRRVRDDLRFPPPVYRDFRTGDVRHSLADIGKARAELGYEPSHTLAEGMRELVNWYLEDMTDGEEYSNA